MASIIYIHGTGVREYVYGTNKKDHAKTYNVIEKKIRKYLPGWNPLDCFWGEDEGVKFHHDGRSIPNYDARAIGGYMSDADQALLRWQLLYGDPYYELLTMQAGAGENPPPDFNNSEDSPKALRKKLIQEIVKFSPLEEFDA